MTQRVSTPQSSGPDAPIDLEDTRETTTAAPRWLVALVIVLAVAVVGTGVFTVLTVGGEPRWASPEHREIERLSAALDADPADTEARLALAYAYQKAGEHERALDEYALVLSSRPDEPGALYNSAVCMLALGREEDGEQALEMTLAAWPAHTLAATLLAERLAERGAWARVADVLLPVLSADPHSADLQALLGEAYEELGEEDLAEERYRHALSYDPDLAEALEGLGRLGVSP